MSLAVLERPKPTTRFDRSRQLQRLSHELVPGGCHTYAKGDDQFPVQSPGFIARGQGCRIWDVDGNEYIEYGMGCRAVTLGHAFGPVVRAAQEEMTRGVNFSRPAEIEVLCAETFLRTIHRAEMVKFTKDGSAATSGALRLARAHTGRDMVAFCADHPFFSYDDWFIGRTAVNAGIPKAVSDLSVAFRYGDIGSLKKLFDEHPGQIAAVILEPAKYAHPTNGFLEKVHKLCKDEGAVLVFDEMITGFRWHLNGAQEYYDITPDLSTFGKGMANGFAVSAIAGKRELMDLGGIHHGRERVFLLSTTHGAETHALAAAIAVMETYRDEPVIDHLWRAGERLRSGVNQAIKRHGVEGRFEILGLPCSMIFATRDANGEPSQSFRTLFLQEIIRHGVIGSSFALSYAHGASDIDQTVDAVDQALAVYAQALDSGPERFLIGPPSKVVYRKYN